MPDPLRRGAYLLALVLREAAVGFGADGAAALPRLLLLVPVNNASERAGHGGPAVARKNFYGSGSLWSGRLAAMMFLLLATLAHGKINPRRWLTWHLESCAEADGRAPADIQPFLPWNLSPERLAAWAEQTTSSSTADTS